MCVSSCMLSSTPHSCERHPLGLTLHSPPQVRFRCPVGIIEAADGTIYVADRMNHCIRIMRPDDGLWTTLCGMPGQEGYCDGVGCEALFNNPWHLAFDHISDTLVISDMGNHCLRRVTSWGDVTTITGVAGESGLVDGVGDVVRFSLPCGVAVDAVGNILVSDSGNQVLRKVLAAASVDVPRHVVTLAGKAGDAGLTDGVGREARFFSPRGIAFDERTNAVFVADLANHAIRSVSLADARVVTVAGGGGAGHMDGVAAHSLFKAPADVAMDGSNRLIVADTGNHCIRQITLQIAGAIEAEVMTLAGGDGADGYCNLPGREARFFSPRGVTVMNTGAVLVIDAWNHSVRLIQALCTPPLYREAASSMAADMHAMLRDTSFADVCFICQGPEASVVKVYAHRVIVATRCEYFGKLLARSSPGSGSGGAGTNEIFLRNTSAQAFQIILNHIYLDSLEVPAELTIPVGALAESYSLLRLRNSCARHCQQSTMLDNAVPRSAPSSPHLCLLCACAMMHATPWID